MCLFDLSSKMVYLFINEVWNDEVVETSWNTCVATVVSSHKIVLIQSHICIGRYDVDTTGEQKWQYEI